VPIGEIPENGDLINPIRDMDVKLAFLTVFFVILRLFPQFFGIFFGKIP
jgi:hypothetical protein